MRVVPHELLRQSDLFLDAVYEGGPEPHAAADPIGRLLPVGNQGGFRFWGGADLGRCKLAVLYTSGAELNWPDTIDQALGRFTYYGDNRTPGRQLHDTPRRGNEFLRQVFEAAHAEPSLRALVPPIFVFEKGDKGRNVIFRGIAVPGAAEVTPLEDLVAVWKTTGRERFQNYRATFTILDCDVIPRAWIESLGRDGADGLLCPEALAVWRATGRYTPLRSVRVVRHRSKQEQLPATRTGRELIRATYEHFRPQPYAFEHCAASLWRMDARNVSEIEVTRPTRDGGRDAVGRYALGPAADPVQLDFALEAKCYALDSPVGVRETSRLVSRLRHRQFGVLVTTSYVGEQAYEEIREDAHPVIVIASRDIVDILREHQIDDVPAAKEWLQREFPL